MSVRKVRVLLKDLIDVRQWDDEGIIAWSNWRMERNRLTKQCREAKRRNQLRQRSRKWKTALSYSARLDTLTRVSPRIETFVSSRPSSE